MITNAVIPVAGVGSRMAPITAAVPKALLPLPREDGSWLAVLHHILIEASSAGVSSAGVVVSPGHRPMIEEYLQAASASGPRLPAIELIIQDKPAGFGDAVLLSRDYVKGRPFLLMLGDHVYCTQAGQKSPAAQVAQAFERTSPEAMIGVQPVGANQLDLVGVCAGEPVRDDVFACTAFVEKPGLAAAQRLTTPGLAVGRWLAHCGIYAFAPSIFDVLGELKSAASAKELALSDAQSLLLSRRPESYRLCRIHGAAYDTGSPQSYAAAMRAMLDRIAPQS
ncbi:MAG: hypothetical protein GXY38_12150 [Planctomycetes bacterium]|nr:hypothetical protein [Planctomycetota bacterium]